MVRVSIEPYRLLFNERVYTSRGSLDDHTVFYVRMTDDDGRTGVGECAPLYGLSAEYGDGLYQRLVSLAKQYEEGKPIDFSGLSSAKFAFECAERQYSLNNTVMYDSNFCKGLEGQRINGLIWMGEIDIMLKRAREKYEAGFRCLKFKIGSKDFANEMAMLSAVRTEFGDDLEMRVDANCAYTEDFYLKSVEPELHRLKIHSIEQPCKPQDIDGLKHCCEKSRIPIALDESLIGTKNSDEIDEILDCIKPKYIILKPTLCGGLSGANLWIQKAKDRGIGYWATSALESNIGLSAIAQWASTIGVDIPQGLGTGMIYSNNIEMGLSIKGERLWMESR